MAGRRVVSRCHTVLLVKTVHVGFGDMVNPLELSPEPARWFVMMLRISWAVALFLLLTLTALSGCADQQPETFSSATRAPSSANVATPVLSTPVPVEELRSDRDRSVTSVGSADLDELVRGNNAFAFHLYHALSDGEGNLFYSPFSISQALAMTSAGARGETQRQMADTLHHRLPQKRSSFCFQRPGPGPSLPGGRVHRERPPRTVMSDEYFRLNIANAIWGQEGYHFLPDFLDVLAEHYGGRDDACGLRRRAGRVSRQDQ